MNDGAADKVTEFAQFFTKMWTDCASRFTSAAFTPPTDADPAEAARQMRGAIFEAMQQSYEDFVRSPQFLEWMKQSMDAAVAFRRQVSDFFTRLHHETQGTTRSDVDSILLAVRHMETRVLDRMDELAGEVQALAKRVDAAEGSAREGQRPRPRAGGRPARTKSRPRPKRRGTR